MANLATVTDINPGTVLTPNLGTGGTIILNGPNADTKVIKITSILVANIDGTNDCDISIYVNIYPYGAAIASTITVPANTTLVVLTKDNYIYLPYNSNGSSLSAFASAANDLEIVVTYEEITCSSA